MDTIFQTKDYDRLFVLCDDNTERLCLPIVMSKYLPADVQVITVAHGEQSKSIEGLTSVWQSLTEGEATRYSCLINVGGGMVCDLGGFAAATFKRGVDFVNVPTSLLAMVDASSGGKTGINFRGLKNEVGVFANPKETIIDDVFLNTLSDEEVLSGYAEMLKHALLDDVCHWSGLLLDDALHPSKSQIECSISVKHRYTASDPREKGLRKALNLGHTIGHAIESHSGQMSHGRCVAYGLVGALYLSVVERNFPRERMYQTVEFINRHYGRAPIDCNDYPALLALIHHDKKNCANDVLFTLLDDIGSPAINCSVGDEAIKEALDFIREA